MIRVHGERVALPRGRECRFEPSSRLHARMFARGPYSLAARTKIPVQPATPNLANTAKDLW
jgi:hypothetical protein